MRRGDDYRLRRIMEVGEQLAGVIESDGITRESILGDFHTQWLITTPLYNIGEQVYALSDEFKDSHPEVPWRAISGMRHRLVHDYEGTNWTIIAEAALVEVPLLVDRIRDLLGE